MGIQLAKPGQIDMYSEKGVNQGEVTKMLRELNISQAQISK